jgi:hypothetical protein
MEKIMSDPPKIKEKLPFKKNKKNNVHYVDNSLFLEKITEHRSKVIAAKEAGTEKPRVPNYLGECFLKIANHLAYKSNFINYTYRDEMISDGIENCITYIDNFDPAKSSNPFAYFTQITYYAFLRRIQKEKKQQATKYRYIKNLDVHDLITQDQDGGEYGNEFVDFLKKQIDQSVDYDKEPVVASTLPKRRPKYLDKPKNTDISLDI